MKKFGIILVIFISLIFGSCSTQTTIKPVSEDTKYSKSILGYWTEGESPFAVIAFLEGGINKGWIYEDRTKTNLIVEMEGKWWIKKKQLFNELLKINPPFPGLNIGDIMVDQIVEISKDEMILIDEEGQKYSNFRVK